MGSFRQFYLDPYFFFNVISRPPKTKSLGISVKKRKKKSTILNSTEIYLINISRNEHTASL